MQEERDFIDETSAKMDPRIGLRRDATKPSGRGRPPEQVGQRRDVDGTAERSDWIISTRSRSYLTTNSRGQGEGDGFKRACKPYKMTTKNTTSELSRRAFSTTRRA